MDPAKAGDGVAPSAVAVATAGVVPIDSAETAVLEGRAMTATELRCVAARRRGPAADPI